MEGKETGGGVRVGVGVEDRGRGGKKEWVREVGAGGTKETGGGVRAGGGSRWTGGRDRGKGRDVEV